MAKLFIGLLSALVVLSALTFLALVSERPVAGGGTRGAASESREAADQRASEIRNLEIAIRSLKTTLDNLSGKVDGLPKKVVAALPNLAPTGAPARGAVPTAGAAAPSTRDLGTTIPEEGAEDFLEEPAPSKTSPRAGEGTRPGEGERAPAPAPPEEE